MRRTLTKAVTSGKAEQAVLQRVATFVEEFVSECQQKGWQPKCGAYSFEATKDGDRLQVSARVHVDKHALTFFTATPALDEAGKAKPKEWNIVRAPAPKELQPVFVIWEQAAQQMRIKFKGPTRPQPTAEKSEPASGPAKAVPANDPQVQAAASAPADAAQRAPQ